MIVFSLFGAAVTLIGILLLIFANFNIGTLATIVLGVVFVLVGLFYKRFNKVLKTVFWVLLCAEVLLVGTIGISGAFDSTDFSEDAVIVLGAGVRGDKVTLPLKYRLDKAIEYEKKNPDALIVVSGGKGFQETVTEAEAMEKYLISKGISADKIIKEERATSTAENMRYSKAILDKRFKEPYKTVIVTNNFHILRSVILAKNEGLGNVGHIHAKIQWYNLIPCYLRESLAVLRTLGQWGLKPALPVD